MHNIKLIFNMQLKTNS